MVSLLTAFFSEGTVSQVWEDNWKRADVDIEGYCDQIHPECTENVINISCDNLNARYRTFKSSSACTLHPSPCAATDAINGQLLFHGEDVWMNNTSGEGFPMISADTFDKNYYISAEVEARAYCGPSQSDGCFMGLVLYNGETNYREIAFLSAPGTTDMKIWRFAGGICDPHPLLDGIEQNISYKLRIDYYGHEGGKWIYFIDDIVRKIEDTTTENYGSILQADPHVALFFVGLQYGNYVEGSLRPLRVWTGSTIDAHQRDRKDGLAATNTVWYAQQVYMGSGVKNITKLNLFLVNGQQYRISAHTDKDEEPGILINEVVYTPDRHGFQDVPIWVPARWDKIWIRIASSTMLQAEFGTSAPATDPYPGRLLVSNDAGLSWSPVDRDMYFVTFERGSPPPLFVEGFETGHAAAWSNGRP